ncbi:glucose-1-phosphate adenylyltransferase subunit GlgD [Exiguobacterium sp. s161]|uniref:glucose-1-phosphate adenylyltransferase subunit GlgD n=1 Tax=Exiguobacterium sp. s161 TaxID=2751191 RepID=UPI001BE6ED15|nr:glucose-1-phosphate adenylyltransferase subunit GlgD [Exiguobacterium sp. s161]
MKVDLLGVINLSGEEGFFKELTEHRNLAAVPFAGRYRLIDFTLTNMVQNDIANIGVFTLEKYRGMMDHLGSGKEWDLDRSNGGLYIFPPALSQDANEFRGDLSNFHLHRDFFLRSKENYVVVSGSNILSAVDYRDVLREHKESNADITVVYTKRELPCKYCRPIRFGEQNRVTAIGSRGFQPTDETFYMETVVLSKNLFVRLIDEAIARGEYDLLQSIIRSQLNRLHVHGYEYRGTSQVIHSLRSYYRESMLLLEQWGAINDFQHVYTKIKHEPPTRYLPGSAIKNSLVANGCKLEGTTTDSILFRGVKVGKHARIKNSIIMQKSVIEEGAVVEYAILDKEVTVKRGQVIRGTVEEPIVIKKQTIV